MACYGPLCPPGSYLFTSRLARDSEIIATLSAGISYNRMLRPFVMAGFIIAVLLWIGNNYVIPNSSRIKTNLKVSTSDAVPNKHFHQISILYQT